jgi:hypothetical protein
MPKKTLVDGVFFKNRHPNAPNFVVGKMSFKLDKFIEFAKQNQQDGWFNIEILKSRDNKVYAIVDDWKPAAGNDQKPVQEIQYITDSPDEEVPF